MPHITINNLEHQKTLTFINDCSEVLAKAIDCPVDWLVFYENNLQAYVENKPTNKTCYIKVEWFARDEKVKDNVAQIITDKLHSFGIEEVAIYFTILDTNNYYENMEKF